MAKVRSSTTDQGLYRLKQLSYFSLHLAADEVYMYSTMVHGNQGLQFDSELHSGDWLACFNTEKEQLSMIYTICR